MGRNGTAETARTDYLLGDPFGSLAVEVGDDHMRAKVGEQPSGRTPDAARSAGDDSNLPDQVFHAQPWPGKS